MDILSSIILVNTKWTSQLQKTWVKKVNIFYSAHASWKWGTFCWFDRSITTALSCTEHNANWHWHWQAAAPDVRRARWCWVASWPRGGSGAYENKHISTTDNIPLSSNLFLLKKISTLPRRSSQEYHGTSEWTFREINAAILGWLFRLPVAADFLT